MSKKSLNTAAGRRFFGKITESPENFPFRFSYGGKTYHGFEGLNARKMTVGGAGFQRVILTAQTGNLSVKADVKTVTEYGQVEYTVYFENHSDEDIKAVCESIESFASPGDFILLKASHGIALDRLVLLLNGGGGNEQL